MDDKTKLRFLSKVLEGPLSVLGAAGEFVDREPKML